MKKLLDMGDHYVSDFVKSTKDYDDRKKYSLNLYLDDDIGAPRLKDLAPREMMWGKYWYRSGMNESMRIELHGLVSEITSRFKLEPNDIWLDIACNDGTLLKSVPNNLKKVGIDPANDEYHKESSEAGEIIQDYFSTDAWRQSTVGSKKAKVITCIAMFYDLDQPRPFVQDLYNVLDDDGLLVLQMSYTPLMIKQMAFDNICHEHVYYYDLKSIKKLFSVYGFEIVDCLLNEANGGSFRIYLRKIGANKEGFGTAYLRDVCSYRVDTILNYEERQFDISNPLVWSDFQVRLEELRSKIVGFVHTQNALGKRIYGYGAGTKGNTLLQYFNLTNNDICAIAERSPYKFGLHTIGTNIPIISEVEMRKAKPDYALVLPWHFIHEFVERGRTFLADGGSFIVPCPDFNLVGYRVQPS